MKRTSWPVALFSVTLAACSPPTPDEEPVASERFDFPPELRSEPMQLAETNPAPTPRAGPPSRVGEPAAEAVTAAPEEPADSAPVQQADPEPVQVSVAEPEAAEPEETTTPQWAGFETEQRRSGEIRLHLRRVTFATSSADVLPGAAQDLNRIAGLLRKYPDLQIIIEGFTDDRGDSEYNLWLSRERAEAVKAAIIRQGISPHRVIARGRGEGEPIASNDSPAGRELNRRVEVVFPKSG